MESNHIDLRGWHLRKDTLSPLTLALFGHVDLFSADWLFLLADLCCLALSFLILLNEYVVSINQTNQIRSKVASWRDGGARIVKAIILDQIGYLDVLYSKLGLKICNAKIFHPYWDI